MPELQEGVQALKVAGIDFPNGVGDEIGDAQGRVFAESELSWSDKKICLLREDQEEFLTPLMNEGWQPVLATADWPQQLQELL